MFGRRRRDIDYDDFYNDDRDREMTRAKPPRALPHLILLAVFGAATLAAVRVTAGVPMFEAVLKALATPCGVLWVLLLVAAYLVTLRRNAFAAILTWTCWLILTACGNSYVASEIVKTLEAPYLDTNVENMEPFDVVLILGGGTSTNPEGIPQLTASGDRLMTAVKLFHMGKANKFVCPGTRWQGILDNELEIHEEQARILMAAGVPAVSIIQIKAGTNTKTELAAFRSWLEKNPAKQIGIVTSAWHLRRVERLAAGEGIEFVAIPCDYLTRRFKPDPNLMVPSGRNLTMVQLALKEYLAEWVDR